MTQRKKPTAAKAFADKSAAGTVDEKTGKTPLLRALEGNSLEKLANLLRQGADPNQADFAGRTPMDAAMKRHWYRAAEMLLAAGAKPPHCDDDPNAAPVYRPTGTHYMNVAEEMANETTLTYYIKKCGDYDYIFRALANGADVNLCNKLDQTPLQVALERKWPYVAVQLVKRGAWLDPQKHDPDEVIDPVTGATRLLAVIMEGEDGHAVRKILDEGADPKKPDRYGLTPLALSRALHWPYVEKLLLERGADPACAFPDPNQKVGEYNRNETPLLCYAAHGQCCHANYQLALLQAGANPDAADAKGWTPAYTAALYGNTWLFDQLQAAGADLLLREKESGTGPLHIACLNNHADIAARILSVHPQAVDDLAKEGETPLYYACQRTGAEELCKYLVGKGASVTAVTTYGSTPLHQAAGKKGGPELVQWLLELGADVNAATKDGDLPLQKAILADDPEKVRLLLAHGTDLKKASGSKYYKPLFMLVNHELIHKEEIAKLLLAAGADPDARNGDLNHKGSLIHFAISYHASAVARALLEAGADPHGTAANGESAMHYCLQMNDAKGVALLLAHGFDPLRPFDFTTHWTGGGGTRKERHLGSAYDEALEAVKKFGPEREYTKMLSLIETHLAGEAPAPEAAPAAKPAAPKPSR